MKEFNYGSDNLKADLMQEPDYKLAHEHLVIACHDALIRYKDGFLLIKRDQEPLKGRFFFVGGRIQRGLSVVESLKKKVKKETGLELTDIKFLQTTRTLFPDEPFGHGHGTDSLNLQYTAIGHGEIKLDNLHSDYIIVKPDDKLEFDEIVNDALKKAFEK